MDMHPGSDAVLLDAFLEIVCADETWLRDEFDSIMAQEWQPPVRPPAHVAYGVARPRRGHGSRWEIDTLSARQHELEQGAGASRRERGPPGRAG